MENHHFTLVLKGSPELTDELADRLFAAGCDDGSPGMCAGVTVIDFRRDADSLENALRSAITHVSAAGCTVERVEIEADNIKIGA